MNDTTKPPETPTALLAEREEIKAKLAAGLMEPVVHETLLLRLIEIEERLNWWSDQAR